MQVIVLINEHRTGKISNMVAGGEGDAADGEAGRLYFGRLHSVRASPYSGIDTWVEGNHRRFIILPLSFHVGRRREWTLNQVVDPKE